MAALITSALGCDAHLDPGEPEERERVRAYIEAVRASGRVPPPPSASSPPAYADFIPYFLSPADFAQPYAFGHHTSGFGKSCDALTVEFRGGPRVIFCFNRMVINCDRADGCGCPYDFNWEPRPRATR
jgi:hypothetical protein